MKDVEKTIKEVCLEIAKRYEVAFIEIGADSDHVHFMIQSIPMYSPTNLVKKKLWGAKFWTSGYYVNTVSEYGNAEAIRTYVKAQGLEYREIYRGQLSFNLV